MNAMAFEITIENEHGLHARPAGLFVRTCSQFEGSVKISKGEITVDGKSLLGMLRLGVKKGEKLVLMLDLAPEHAMTAFQQEINALVSAQFNE